MSKRYGRQQKRKAKAEIEMLNEMLKRRSDTISKAANIIDIARKINPNSVCFDPKSVGLGVDRYAIQRLNSQSFDLSTANQACTENAFINVVDLYKLESNLEDSDFNRSIHFHVRIGGNARGYSISKEGLRDVPIDFISNEIAKSFKRESNI